jgi:hypothetical protein
MVSLAANRRNARKSTGPRSRDGKKRASDNAYRHGLSVGSITEFSQQLEKLAAKIADDTKDEFVLDRARVVAYAQLDLARVRRIKVAVVQRMCTFGTLDATTLFSSVREAIRYLHGYERGRVMLPAYRSPSTTMPSHEPERTTEGLRRALPELLRLDRYERRAAARRDRAVRDIVNYNNHTSFRSSRKGA